MLRLLNKDRKENGLKPLFMQSDLQVVARKHSKDMAKLDYFDHTNFTGQTHADRYEAAHISDVVSGENLAKIRGYKHPVQRAEIGLMNSPGHRANILNKHYNCVGIGIHRAQDKTYFYTQNFAQREIVLLKKVKERIKRGSSLKLLIKPVKGAKLGVYRVLEGKQVLKEKGFQLSPGKNQLSIPFAREGRFTIEIYIGVKGKRSLNLANKLQLRVTKGWFW